MNTGRFYKGNVKITINQSKKHVSQMSQSEIELIVDKIKKIYKARGIQISAHLNHKMTDYLSFNMNDLYSLIRCPDGCIIEYNVQPYDKRVLLRSHTESIVNIDGRMVMCNLCIVYSLITGNVVTAYYNECTDKHKHINMHRYNEKLAICL